MRIQDIPWLDFTVPQKKLDVSVAATFDMGDYQTARTTQPVVLFRVTTAPVKGGPYWTTELPKDRMEAKMSLAVRPEWNQRQYYQTAVLPIGTEIQIGFAAPQGSFSYWQHAKLAGGEANMPYGRDLTGGCVQVFMDGGMPEQYVIESGRPLEFVSNYSEFDRKAVELEEAAARERAEAARIKRAPMTKNVSGQVRANAAFTQQDENGQIVSPNGTGQVIDGNVQTDIGHVSSFENKYEVKYSEKAGLTQQAHNQMFSNPGQFQVEPSRENRSHAFENHDENDAMMNISAYACGEDRDIASRTMIIPPENGSDMGTLAVKNAKTGEMEPIATFAWERPEESARALEDGEKPDKVQENAMPETERAETSRPVTPATEEASAETSKETAPELQMPAESVRESAPEQEKADAPSPEADTQDMAKSDAAKPVESNAGEASAAPEKSKGTAPESSETDAKGTAKTGTVKSADGNAEGTAPELQMPAESVRESAPEQEKADAPSPEADTQDMAKSDAAKPVESNAGEASAAPEKSKGTAPESLETDAKGTAKTGAAKSADGNAEGTAPSARNAGGSGSRFETGNTGENGKDNSASDDYYYGYY
ncbi:GH-E family nuclease [uncultured Ruminococcus sp.]|uniref:HNH/ENDO VII family nuclease n=1 Tax=uncultured Ruminococcus sp. TaxID=165186 RepID=UPI0026DC101E|nr:GH-E family nuclease [uncultured Ruminococcus sp.]